MTYELVPLNVGDIIERFFRILLGCIRRLAGIFLLVGVPASVVMAVTMDSFFSTLIELVQVTDHGGFDASMLQAAMSGAGFLLVGIVLLFVADVTILVTSQLVVCGEVVGRDIGIRESFELCTFARLGRALGQRLLGELASGLAIVAPYLLIPLAVAANARAVFVVLIVMLFLVALPIFLYLRVRWAFGTTVIAWEESEVLSAFTRSGYLVSGNGWRLFGIMAVFAIIIGIALSMLMLPIEFWALKDFFLLGMQESARNVAQESPEKALRLFANLGFAYGLVAGAGSLLQTSLKSVYLPILYFDLRARRDEFAARPVGRED